MKTTQGWGWLAAGVLALGLNGFYHDGGAAYLHRALAPVIARVAERTGPVLELATGHADLFMARTGMMAARSETASCRLAIAMTRVHSKMAGAEAGLANFEAMTARQEAVMARMEAQRARMEARLARVRLAPVAFNSAGIPGLACPRVRVNIPRVSVPRVPMVKIPAPVVQVDMLGGGPI
jgi:hypothetical protein